MAGQAPAAEDRRPRIEVAVAGGRPDGRRPFQGPGDDRDQGLVCTGDRLILKPSELEMTGDGRAERRDLRGDVIMLTPPLRDRGRQPALEGDRVGAAILARTSVGAAFWK